MNDFLNSTAGSLATIAAALTVFLAGLAAWLPKIMNGIKGDGLNGNVLDRLIAMEKHAAVQDKKSIQQDVKIHRFAVKVTKLVIVMMRLEGLLQQHKIDIPQDLVDDMIELRKDDIEDATE